MVRIYRKAEKFVKSRNFILAKEIYQKALDKRRDKCSDTTLLIARGLVVSMTSIGEFNQALQKALLFARCRQKGVLEIYNNIGILYSIKGNSDSSIFFYKKALQTSDLGKKAKTHNNLGVLYAGKNLDSSLHYHSLTLNYHKNQNDKKQTTRSYNNIAKAYRLANLPDSAITHYQKALIANKTTKGAHLDSFLALESLLSKAELLPGNLQTLLKTDSLTKYLQTYIKRRSDKLRLLRQLKRVTELALPTLARLHQDNTSNRRYRCLLFYFVERSKANILLDEISQKKQVANTGVISLDSLQQRLDTQTVVIEYVQTKAVLYTLIVARKGFDVHTIRITGRELHKRIMHYRYLMFTFKFSKFAKESYQLYKLLISPIAGSVSLKSRWVILPSLELSGIPFDNFIKELPPGKGKITLNTFKTLKYLLFDHVMSYHLSSTLAFTASKPNNSPFSLKSFTGLACSRFEKSGRKLKPLPYTKTEVLVISKHFKRKRVYIDSLATKAVLQRLKTGILHIATHGFYNRRGKNDFLTGVYLNEGKEVLTAKDVYTMGIEANTVVLSGCKTGIGKPVKGEGVLGFLRAFVYSGTRNIVFTPWSVPDKNTAEFMEVFYKYIAQGNEPLGALTLAKRHFFKTRFYPVFWTGYQIL